MSQGSRHVPPVPGGGPKHRPVEEVPGKPAEPPRAVDAAVARAGWVEPRVRFLWLLAMVLVVAAGWLTVLQFQERAEEIALINGGAAVEATVWSRGGPRQPGHALRAGPVVMEYDFQGKKAELEGELSDPPADLKAGGTVRIRLDPADPRRWTDRARPQPIIRHLGPLLALVPVIGLCLAGAWLVRRRVLRLWRDGVVRQAVVVDIRHTALAPLRRLVRCALRDERGGRLLGVYLPGGGTLRRDDVIWVITPARKPNRAIAADMFAPLAGRSAGGMR